MSHFYSLTSAGLHSMDEAQLIETCRAIPKSALSLTLDCFDLLQMSSNLLKIFFSGLPKRLNSLVLSSVEADKAQALDSTKLTELFASIPRNVQTLSLNGHKLGSRIDLESVFAVLHDNLQSLDLMDNDLNHLSQKALAQLFTDIPRSVKSLNLDWNDFGSSVNSLESAFAGLPENLESLYLHQNELHKLSLERLTQLFDRIPKKLNSLELDSNGFDSSSTFLTNAFRALPENLRSLSLKDNRLNGSDPKKLTELFQGIPPNISALNLSGNPLNFLVIGSENAFAALPRNLKSLNLSNSRLGQLSLEQLTQLFDSIPKKLRSLDLSQNGFSFLFKIGLENAFAALPRKLESLNLRDTRLDQLNLERLTLLFKSIPQSIQRLNLGMNPFNFLVIGLEDAFAALPRNLKSLNLNGTKLFTLVSERLTRLLKNVPPNVQLLELIDNLEEASADKLVELAGCLPQLTTIKLSFREVKAMTPAQRDALKKIFPQIKTTAGTIFVGSPPGSEYTTFSFFRSSDREPRSLKNLAALSFLKKRAENADASDIRDLDLPKACEQALLELTF